MACTLKYLHRSRNPVNVQIACDTVTARPFAEAILDATSAQNNMFLPPAHHQTQHHWTNVTIVVVTIPLKAHNAQFFKTKKIY